MYLPDGTASLVLARPGLTIRAMLAGICEKRGLSLPDIKVYLVGNEQVRTWPGPQLTPFLTLIPTPFLSLLSYDHNPTSIPNPLDH